MEQIIKDLIVKYLSNDIDADEMSDLHDWLKEDKHNQQLFNKFQTAWLVSGKSTQKELLASDESWKKFLTKTKLKQLERKKGRVLIAKYYKNIAVAASWLIFIIIGSLLLQRKEKALDEFIAAQKSPTEIAAPKGAKCKIVLPDSSTVWLNAGSKIKYDKSFNFKDRTIELIGEAYFIVAKNEGSEFKVKTSDLIVRALGTKFNVKAYPEEKTITATLEEGIIDVKLINGKETAEQIILKPNENMIFYKACNELQIVASQNKVTDQPDNIPVTKQSISKIEIIPNVNTELYTSWKDDRWIFLGEPLPDLASKLERRFNVEIVFAEDELRNYKFSGTIENETIEQIVQALRLTAPLKYQIKKNTIILTVDKNLKRKYKKIMTPQ